jgi:hypothetical protein
MVNRPHRIAAVNERGLARSEAQSAASEESLRRSLILTFALSLVGGLILALLTIGFTLRLERELDLRRADLQELSTLLLRAQERPQARASWNYNLSPEAGAAATVTYHMNRLQSLDVPEDYSVTLNGSGSIDPAKVLRRLVYHHPLYTSGAVQAQARWSEISGVNRTHFCGAYWMYGFHEDGLNSALRVARSLGVGC